jgi:hypothetical protein
MRSSHVLIYAPGEPGMDAFADALAFELGEAAEDAE